jgi:nucleotide-binding universal stress UspA family protein
VFRAVLFCPPPRAVVLEGVPAEKILEVAEHEGADLIVLGVRK